MINQSKKYKSFLVKYSITGAVSYSETEIVNQFSTNTLTHAYSYIGATFQKEEIHVQFVNVSEFNILGTEYN